MERKATNRHVFLRMVREVEMLHNWFGSVFIVDLNIPKVFPGTVTQSAVRFADVYFFFHKVQGDEIGGNAREMIGDGNSSLRSGNFLRVGDERTSPTLYAHTSECAGLVIRFECTVY